MEQEQTAPEVQLAFLADPGALASFVERLRAAGVKHFVHPSGLTVSFEAGAVVGRAQETDPRW